ncbi:TRNA (5-methylaminomethyl-2-thiouridylate)-methyltransferase [Azorhizobium caulinodans ORS 571]|uniref:tRNA-specific 2-thiouridylase MnmA n=1 Tax=Azorhizobium caulinodans (strain ATCC 43989 / DSM 5975 / JCM 20966 / LMG 6465 / NBRC 14845 / NCIMB 13405 / ORS 571) TaxID=438753 RepID=MNMA_AZOC5|nr:RecName: Full=tRNA-specific 2-thiouridylase MnmA [Azorhizobium caulinodans ORS 571]BAF90348.1 TRNA (5-methylaminomethyl-2-thiouridylate)-methyltransferase [Azorhizobium caulinodans ORS 571]
MLPDLTDIGTDPASTRVVVAMSGGVDSSVVAGLLARAGFDVVGVTLQLYDQGEAARRKGACCAGQDIYDARDVADRLGIPHYVLDYESRFREEVIERFADSYAAGFTPIPCVDCNRTVKFRDLLATAEDLGASVLATGHYVASRALPDGRRGLFRAAEENRDQSYFLYATTQAQATKLRFPLGGMRKSDVRALAAELGLPVADKPDSQDICFVPGGDYAEVVERLRPEAGEAGDIVHLDGRVLGRHRGVMHYTIGQRKGLGISTPEPLYVVAIDAARREVRVGPREALAVRSIGLTDINWLGDVPLLDACAAEQDIYVKVRSTRPPTPARLLRDADGAPTVELLAGEEGVAPGQACVFYDAASGAARLLGGGTIVRAERAGRHLAAAQVA